MAKLYYTATSCGASNFISAFAAGIKIEAEQVNLQTHKTASGVDFYTINPKGNVPTIVLDDGTVLNENAATLQWIADQAPGKIAPEYGTRERYLVQQYLSYTSSEVHGTITPLFNPTISDEVKTHQRTKLAQKLEYLNKNVLANKNFLVGNKFSVADAYLGIVLSWAPHVSLDLSPYPAVQAYAKNFEELSFVKEGRARIAQNPATTVA